MKDEKINRETVVQKNGLEPGQMLDVLGLAGDSADNIPGVPGIGPKTAVTLLKSFSSMEALYERIHEVKAAKQREKLLAHKEQALMSRELATINTHAPIDIDISAFKLDPPDNDTLAKVFKEMEFRQLQKAYPVSGDAADKKYHAVLDPAALKELISKLGKAEIFALDTETTAIDPMAADLVGLSFAVTPDEAFYIPCGHTYPGAPEQLARESVLNQLKPVLEDEQYKKIGQNIKYDWTVLKRHGIALAGVVFDTMVASYLINPEKRAHNLDQIAMDFLDHKMISYEEVTTDEGRKLGSFSDVKIDKAVPYACEDADITLAAYEKFISMLAAQGLTRLFDTVEMPLIPVLMRMEMAGIRVDKDRLQELSKDMALQLEQTEQEIYSLAGEQFNINSSQQLGKILFEKLKLPTQKKTKKKTAYSTDVEVLKALSDRHELPAMVLRHRSIAKLKSTYVDALSELINPETGRVHTSYNQTVTATGRLSSSNPNLQNIPIRTEEGRKVRQAFIPEPGWSFVSMDYSQIELRLLAHYSGDDILIDAFNKDEDIHTRTAAEVFQALPVMITNELRQQAKVINFGIMYGMSPFSLSRELKISQKMAKTYIDHYFKRYAGVKRFIDETIQTARETLMTATELGRIRLLPDINSKNANIRGFAERNAVNTKIQGTAADLIKLAMIKVDAAILENGLQSRMLLSVHDEIVFEVPPEEIKTVKTIGREIMETIWSFKVPLKVNVSEGKDWAEAH
jgi:DNA polymerase-1